MYALAYHTHTKIKCAHELHVYSRESDSISNHNFHNNLRAKQKELSSKKKKKREREMRLGPEIRQALK
jgi:hypothetical protein